MIPMNHVRMLLATGGLSCLMGCARDAVNSVPHVSRPTSRPAPHSKPSAAPDYKTAVAPLIDRYCMDCHHLAVGSGGVILEARGGGRRGKCSTALAARGRRRCEPAICRQRESRAQPPPSSRR